MVYQPIYRLNTMKISGFESLARFSTDPIRTPDVWFREAASVGLSAPLEWKAAELAIQRLADLPSDVYIAVNISPKTIAEGKLDRVFDGYPVDRILLEITEHTVIESYDDISEKLEALRRQGLKVAVDDAGAGHSSFRHILKLAPNVIKLDHSITRSIDKDKSRHALASAFMGFANDTGAEIVAEGVETELELSALRDLGVNMVQGYLLGRPVDFEMASQNVRLSNI